MPPPPPPASPETGPPEPDGWAERLLRIIGTLAIGVFGGGAVAFPGPEATRTVVAVLASAGLGASAVNTLRASAAVALVGSGAGLTEAGRLQLPEARRELLASRKEALIGWSVIAVGAAAGCAGWGAAGWVTCSLAGCAALHSGRLRREAARFNRVARPPGSGPRARPVYRPLLDGAGSAVAAAVRFTPARVVVVPARRALAPLTFVSLLALGALAGGSAFAESGADPAPRLPWSDASAAVGEHIAALVALIQCDDAEAIRRLRSGVTPPEVLEALVASYRDWRPDEVGCPGGPPVAWGPFWLVRIVSAPDPGAAIVSTVDGRATVLASDHVETLEDRLEEGAIEWLPPRITSHWADVQPYVLPGGQCGAIVRYFDSVEVFDLDGAVTEQVLRFSAGADVGVYVEQVTEVDEKLEISLVEARWVAPSEPRTRPLTITYDPESGRATSPAGWSDDALPCDLELIDRARDRAAVTLDGGT